MFTNSQVTAFSGNLPRASDIQSSSASQVYFLSIKLLLVPSQIHKLSDSTAQSTSGKNLEH